MYQAWDTPFWSGIWSRYVLCIIFFSVFLFVCVDCEIFKATFVLGATDHVLATRGGIKAFVSLLCAVISDLSFFSPFCWLLLLLLAHSLTVIPQPCISLRPLVMVDRAISQSVDQWVAVICADSCQACWRQFLTHPRWLRFPSHSNFPDIPYLY